HLRPLEPRPFLERRALGREFLALLERLVFARPALAMFVRHPVNRLGVRIAGHDDLDPLLLAEDRASFAFGSKLILHLLKVESRIDRRLRAAEAVRARERAIRNHGLLLSS